MSPNVNYTYNNKDFVKLFLLGEVVTGYYAKLLLEQAGLNKVKSSNDLVILDNGCGSGVVADRLMEMLDASSKAKLDLICADVSEPMITFVKSRAETKGWKGVRAIKADAQATKLPDDIYTHVLMNFGPAHVSDPLAVCEEAFRSLQPGGTFGASIWETIGWAPDVREAFKSEGLPAGPENQQLLTMFTKDPYYDPKFVKGVLEKVGFVDIDVKVVPKTIPMEVKDTELMFSGFMGMLTASWSEEEKKKYTEAGKKAAAKYVQAKYGENGSVTWHWAAVLVTAKKPA